MAGIKHTSLTKTGIAGDVQEKLTKELLIGSVVIDIESDESGGALENLTLKLKDGRIAVLTETHWRFYDCGCGNIEIEIDGKEYP